jgi:hypothetical protein
MRFIILTLLTLVSVYSFTQNYEHPIRIFYNGGNFQNTGFGISTDLMLHTKTKIKEKRKRKPQIDKTIFLSPTLSFYAQPQLLVNTHLGAQVIRQRKKNNKRFMEFGLGLGGTFKTNTNETWEVNEGDATALGYGVTRFYLAPTTTLGIGRNLSIAKLSSPLGIYAKINGAFLLNYNTGVVPELTTEIGLRFNLNPKPAN